MGNNMVSYCDCDPLIDSYGIEYHNDEFDIKCDYPCATGTRFCAIGQCFTTPASPRRIPCEVTFYLRKVGNPSGWMWCMIFDVTGTCGTDCVPDPDAFLTGTGGFSVSSTLTTSWQLITFAFGLDVCLLPNHCYAVVFVAWSGYGGLNEENYIQVAIHKLANGGHAGNTVFYRTGAWGAQDRADTIFYLCGNDCPSDSPIPNPTPESVPTEQHLPREPYQEEVPPNYEEEPYIPEPERKPLPFEKKQLEHKNILLQAGVGIPYNKIVHTTNVGLGFKETLPIRLKAPIGMRVFFETKLKSKVGIPFDETLHLISSIGIPYEETVKTKENLRSILYTINEHQTRLDDHWKVFLGMMNTFSKQLKGVNEKSEEKDVETKQLFQNYLETLGAFIEKMEKEKTKKKKWLED